MEKRAVDRHQFPANEIKLAGQKHKGAVRCLERSPVLLPERRDGAVAGRKPPQKPDQLQIPPRLAFQTARGANLVEVAVQIELQQVGRIVRRLANLHATLGMLESKLCQIERINIDIDRSHRIVGSDVIFHPCRKK
jgi:hypothetical protein